MRLKMLAVTSLALIVAAPAMLHQPAEAAQKKRIASQSTRQVAVSQPRARIRVQRRSFLDAGTEVLPGERKFTDYAIPPGYSPTGVIDNTAASRRDPLPGPFTLSGRRNPYPWNWCVGCY